MSKGGLVLFGLLYRMYEYCFAAMRVKNVGYAMAIDFWTPAVPEAQRHPNYRAMLSPLVANGRAEFNNWADGFVDRDGKIVKEFQTTFNSVFWEVCLYRSLLELGFGVDMSHERPDFLVSKGETEIAIEAVVANSAVGAPPEWSFDEKFINVSNDFTALNLSAMLRYTSAIHGKVGKYRESYSTLSHVSGKPFVIALGAYDQPLFWMEFDRPIKAVLYDYYVDEQGDVQAEVIDERGVPAKRLKTIQTKNGGAVELGLFNSDGMKEVSAVVFSCVATNSKLLAMSRVGKNMVSVVTGCHLDGRGRPIPFSVRGEQYRENASAGIHVFHNPYAEHKIPLNVFRSPYVSQSYVDEKTSELRWEFSKDFLVMRRTMQFSMGK